MPFAVPTAASPARVSVTTASTTVLPASGNRSGFTLQNEGPGDLYLKFGAAATLTSYTLVVPSNSYFEQLTGVTYQGIVTACTATGTALANVTDFTG